MNIADEAELRSRLGAELDLLEPSPLPLDTVVKKGRIVMIRKRVLAAAAVLLVAAAAIAAPKAIHYLGEPPASAMQYHVTVNPPGNGSAMRLIASGRVTYGGNDMRWSVSGIGTGRHFHLYWSVGSWRVYHNGQLISESGAGRYTAQDIGVPNFPRKPVAFITTDFGAPVLGVMAVRADVRYVLVSLSNGQVIMLRPVAVLGAAHPRLIAFGLPFATALTEITAYSAHGELGYTVPFTGNEPYNPGFPGTTSATIYLGHWFSPGQAALPRPAQVKIGRRVIGGVSWAEYINIGPWGTCVSPPGDPGSFCYPVSASALTHGKAVRQLDASGYQGQDINNDWIAIIARPSVSSLTVTEPHGRTLAVKLYSIGGVKFGLIVWTAHNKISGWVAYSATGRRLASGPAN